MSVFMWLTSAAFGAVANENEAIIKLSLFVLVFAVLSKSAARLFSENKFVAAIFSMVIALIGVRMMPIVWLLPMGKFIWVLALLVLPYLIVDSLVHEWAFLKVALLVAAYFFAYLLMSALNYWGFGPVMESMGLMSRIFFKYRWQSIAAISAIILFVIAQVTRKKNRESGRHKL